MSIRMAMDLYQFVWSLESHAQQRLAWDDAAEARLARARAEALAAVQIRAMLDANPSGALGRSQVNDPDRLSESGLL